MAGILDRLEGSFRLMANTNWAGNNQVGVPVSVCVCVCVCVSVCVCLSVCPCVCLFSVYLSVYLAGWQQSGKKKKKVGCVALR